MIMEIRSYTDSDYPALELLYRSSTEFPFDSETDSRPRLSAKIERDSGSILLAFKGDKLIGSVSIIEDGRIA
jgi:predicted N-acetyltransferase YhbS